MKLNKNINNSAAGDGCCVSSCSDSSLPALPWVSDEWVEVMQLGGYPPHFYRVSAIESIRMGLVNGGMTHLVTLASGESFSLGSECGHSLMLRVCAVQRTAPDCPPPTSQGLGSVAPVVPIPESDAPPSHSSETHKMGSAPTQRSPLARTPLRLRAI